MSKIKLSNGSTYAVEDYATPNSFSIRLSSRIAYEVLETLTEGNLSVIQFLTDRGTVTGEYHNKLLCGYTDNGRSLAVELNDLDLCRYGLVLGDDDRILYAAVQRYAPDGAIMVDTLPDGSVSNYLYVDGAYIYDPLPEPEQPVPDTELTVWDELDAAYQEGVDSL